MCHHLGKRLGPLAAVNVDHVHARHGPAKKRDVQQLFFEHIGQRVRHDGGHAQGFPSALMLDQQHRRAGPALGQVVHAGDPVLNPQNHIASPNGNPQPARTPPVHRGAANKQRGRHHKRRPWNDRDDHPE